MKCVYVVAVSEVDTEIVRHSCATSVDIRVGKSICVQYLLSRNAVGLELSEI